jgi:hypothetical protein
VTADGPGRKDDGVAAETDSDPEEAEAEAEAAACSEDGAEKFHSDGRGYAKLPTTKRLDTANTPSLHIAVDAEIAVGYQRKELAWYKYS